MGVGGPGRWGNFQIRQEDSLLVVVVVVVVVVEVVVVVVVILSSSLVSFFHIESSGKWEVWSAGWGRSLLRS